MIAVDDDAFAAVLAETLAGRGESPVVGRARTGAEAMEQVTELRPDVVVIDVQAALFDGVEVTRRLRTQHPPVRIVVVSSTDYCERALEARLAGADDYVRRGRVERDLAAAARADGSPTGGGAR